MTVRIINADVMEGLRQLEDESVHCVVTSCNVTGEALEVMRLRIRTASIAAVDLVAEDFRRRDLLA